LGTLLLRGWTRIWQMAAQPPIVIVVDDNAGFL
jgi:hypothetical protein